MGEAVHIVRYEMDPVPAFAGMTTLRGKGSWLSPG